MNNIVKTILRSKDGFLNSKSIFVMPIQYLRYGKLVHDIGNDAFHLPIENEAEDAIILYKRNNGTLELYETLVPEHLRGQGIAHYLAKEVFDYVSANGLKVILKCDFLQKFYEENPVYEHIVVHESD